MADTSQNKESNKSKISQRVDAAISSPDVAKHYCNGFVTSLGASDVLLILENNHMPEAVINMSFSTAKTLVGKLQETIKLLEDVTGQNIMTSDNVEKSLIDNSKT